MDNAGLSTRVDRWLWFARCFKTRSLAAKACESGRVRIAGQRVKPAKALRPGDTVEVALPRGVRVLEVVALGDRRGPASEAQKLYIDHSPPPEARRERVGPRPTKRDRRRIGRLSDEG